MERRFQFSQNEDQARPWDMILFESPNFVAVPTRGCLVEGWLLIVPRSHHFCVGAFSNELLAEFQAFRWDVQKALETVYGPVVGFEHGPTKQGKPAGCGVDHAHFHLVPWRGRFGDAIRSYGVPDFAWKKVGGCDELSAIHSANQDYLYFEEIDGESSVAISDYIPSQFFRRVVASAVGSPELYDWKHYDGTETVRATSAALRSASTPSEIA